MKQFIIEGTGKNTSFKLRLSEENLDRTYNIVTAGMSVFEIEQALEYHLGEVTITNVFDFENEILKG